MIAILGGGKMGEALLAGLIEGGTAPTDIGVLEPDRARAAQLVDTYGVRAVDVPDLAQADTLLVAVKPNVVLPLLGQLAPVVTAGHLVVSIAAGVTLAAMQDVLPAGVPVVRGMPNTPALVGQGITAISAGDGATDEHLATAERLLAAVGQVVRVPEYQLDAVTGVSGSGPAYVFLMVEGWIDAAVLAGLPRPLATQLVTQTLLGSATMLARTGEHPTVLREAVTSPGGTTAAALRELETHGVRAALSAAVDAAARRSRELGG